MTFHTIGKFGRPCGLLCRDLYRHNWSTNKGESNNKSESLIRPKFDKRFGVLTKNVWKIHTEEIWRMIRRGLERSAFGKVQDRVGMRVGRVDPLVWERCGWSFRTLFVDLENTYSRDSKGKTDSFLEGILITSQRFSQEKSFVAQIFCQHIKKKTHWNRRENTNLLRSRTLSSTSWEKFHWWVFPTKRGTVETIEDTPHWVLSVLIRSNCPKHWF